MKLGIIGAMDIEIETIRSRMQNTRVTTCTGMEFCEGLLMGVDSVVVKCGVGKVNAALCAQTLCTLFGVTHLINTGIAGALSPELSICDLVISSSAVYHDFDCRAFGYPMGNVPGLPVTFPADPALVRCLQDAAARVEAGRAFVGTVASGDQFVCTQEQKDRIAAVTGAFCTEMEGAAIAHAAYRNSVPFVIIRAISDNADDKSASMDYPTFEHIAAQRCASLVIAAAQALSCK